MPIKIPESLPARGILESENVFVMTESRAVAQDIRPLKIAVLNLMPTKIVTETQIARLLSNTPLQVDLTLLYTTTHRPKHTPGAHLDEFYRDFRSVASESFDGLIVTGAPVENLEFGDVDYWPELCEVMDFARTNVFSTVYICWAAQAALYYYHSIPKYPTQKKIFGVFEHEVLVPTHPLVRGFDDKFPAPHSRHTEVRRGDIERNPNLRILAVSREAGVYLVAENNTVFQYGDRYVRGGNIFFVTGHSEYDADTLAREYRRDVEKGLPIDMPAHYFPNDDPRGTPLNTWRAHAHLMFTNWLNYFVYQETPYDIQMIKGRK